MRSSLLVSLALSMCLTARDPVVAQEPFDELTPRAISDSTYAVRLSLDVLQEQLRSGRLDPRTQDQDLQAAVLGLAKAARNRSRRPPHPDLGVVWDLQIEVIDFQPVGPNELRVRARVSLATEPDTTTAPVLFSFQRNADRWDLIANPGLAGRLNALAARAGKKRP